MALNQFGMFRLMMSRGHDHFAAALRCREFHEKAASDPERKMAVDGYVWYAKQSAKCYGIARSIRRKSFG